MGRKGYRLPINKRFNNILVSINKKKGTKQQVVLKKVPSSPSRKPCQTVSAQEVSPKCFRSLIYKHN